MVLFQGVHSLGQGARHLLDASVLFRRQLVEVLVDRLRRLDVVQDAVQASHQLSGEGQERVAGWVRSAELDALGSRGGTSQRNTDGGRTVTSGVHQVDRSLEARNQTVVGVQGWVGEGQHGGGVLDQTTDVPASQVGQASVALLVVEQRLAVLPQGLVAVHTSAVVVGDRLRHEGCSLASQSSGLVDNVLVLHQVIACVLQGVEAIVDLLLTSGGHLVVGTLEDQTDLLQVGDHVVAQVLGVVDRRNREVTLLDTVLESDVRGAVLFGVNAGVPRSLDGVNLVEGTLHGVLEANLVEDEELGLRGEGSGVGDAGGLQVRLGLAGDLTRIAGVRLVGQRVDDGEGHVEGLVLAERVNESGLNIRDQLHVGFVDGLEALNGGTIERHAVGEGVLQEFASRHSEVLLNADKIGETDGDILDAFLVDKGLGVFLGLEFGHGTAPFMWNITVSIVKSRVSPARNLGYENVS